MGLLDGVNVMDTSYPVETPLDVPGFCQIRRLLPTTSTPKGGSGTAAVNTCTGHYDQANMHHAHRVTNLPL